MTTLTRRFFLVLMVMAFAASACGALDAKEVANTAATKVYEQIDAGQLAQIWTDSDPRFQDAVAKDKFVSLFAFTDPAKGPLGKRSKSDQKGFTSAGADGGGQLVELSYTSTWANDKTDDSMSFVVKDNVAKLVALNLKAQTLK